jgi:preprotein translocase subunit SecB
MTSPKNRSGYRLSRLYYPRQSYALNDPTELPAEEGDTEDSEREFSVAWDWRITGESRFSISLGILIPATRRAPELIEVGVVGDFHVIGDTPSVDIKQFVTANGPAILFPYLRQAISQLTTNGPRGSYMLPALNILEMLKDHSYDESTGAQQLAEADATSLPDVSTKEAE